MLQIVILVCSTSLQPVECKPETALDILAGPQVAGVGECAMVGQATMASTSLGKRPDEYIKIRCEPKDGVRTASTF